MNDVSSYHVFLYLPETEVVNDNAVLSHIAPFLFYLIICFYYYSGIYRFKVFISVINLNIVQKGYLLFSRVQRISKKVETKDFAF